MDSRQQKETLEYFSRHAGHWRDQAEGKVVDEVNIVKQRNDCVLEVIDRQPQMESALDVGCGTGDLVLEAAARGISTDGVDFAPDMIKIAEEKKGCRGLDKARFHCCSIFDFDIGDSQWDVISANGFIEYISYEKMIEFFRLSFRGLRPGGSLVVGSRNRLFNLMSLNRFTEEEINSGQLLVLYREAIALTGMSEVSELLGVRTVPAQSEDYKHPETGVKVSTRYQYTPAQLAQNCNEIGLKPAGLFPVHVHGVPPAFKDKHPEVHAAISNLLQGFAGQGMALIPFSSTFMLHATKG